MSELAGDNGPDDVQARRDRLAEQGYVIEFSADPAGHGDGVFATVVAPDGQRMPGGSRDSEQDALRAALVIAETDAVNPRK